MSKLKKCLYLINLLERKGALTLEEINDYYQYSSLYDGVIGKGTVPCYNFYQQLLWHREKLEVMFPQYVREKLKDSLQKMLERY